MNNLFQIIAVFVLFVTSVATSKAAEYPCVKNVGYNSARVRAEIARTGCTKVYIGEGNRWCGTRRLMEEYGNTSRVKYASFVITPGYYWVNAAGVPIYRDSCGNRLLEADEEPTYSRDVVESSSSFDYQEFLPLAELGVSIASMFLGGGEFGGGYGYGYGGSYGGDGDVVVKVNCGKGNGGRGRGGRGNNNNCDRPRPRDPKPCGKKPCDPDDWRSSENPRAPGAPQYDRNGNVWDEDNNPNTPYKIAKKESKKDDKGKKSDNKDRGNKVQQVAHKKPEPDKKTAGNKQNPSKGGASQNLSSQPKKKDNKPAPKPSSAKNKDKKDGPRVSYEVPRAPRQNKNSYSSGSGRKGKGISSNNNGNRRKVSNNNGGRKSKPSFGGGKKKFKPVKRSGGKRSGGKKRR